MNDLEELLIKDCIILPLAVFKINMLTHRIIYIWNIICS